MKDFRNIDINEVYRYMGFKGEIPEPHIREMTTQVIKEISDAAAPKFCSAHSHLVVNKDAIALDWFTLKSKALAKHLTGCESCIVFAATLGTGVDMLIYKYSALSPAKAVAAQAAATALIENYADEICRIFSEEAVKENLYITARFSPGYEDLSLDAQRDFLSVLNAGKRIGLCLTDSDMLTPVKSITAIVGKTKTELNCHTHKCHECSNANCAYKI